MQLTEVQRDALVELLNIGFGRAGASLSRLTNQRVLLEVPHVAVHPILELEAHLSSVIKDEVASIHQAFSGPVGGDALLILDPVAAASLKELLTNEPALPLVLDASSREVLTEVGNILLNACLGTFGNLLKIPVTFHRSGHRHCDAASRCPAFDRRRGWVLPICPRGDRWFSIA